MISFALAWALVLTAPGEPLAAPSCAAGEQADFPGATWCPAEPTSFRSGRTKPISRIVIHTMEGYYATSIEWFQTADRPEPTSAHYLVSHDGRIAQSVREADTAHHATIMNAESVGIEQEGFPACMTWKYREGACVDDGAPWLGPELYAASASIVRHLSEKHRIPRDRRHVIGHNEVPYPNDHSDPCSSPAWLYERSCNGHFWDWVYFMQLVNGVLVRPGSGGPMYWVQNGKRYRVADEAVLELMQDVPGWDADLVEHVDSEATLGRYAEGPALSDLYLSDDLIVASRDSQWFLIEDGYRRRIADPAAFAQLARDLDDAIAVSDAVLALAPEGVPIASSKTIGPEGVLDFEEFRAASLGGLGGPSLIGKFYQNVGIEFAGATSLSQEDGSLNFEDFPPRSGDALIYDTTGGTGEINVLLSVPAVSVGGYFTYNTPLRLEGLNRAGEVVAVGTSRFSSNFVGTGNPPNEFIDLTHAGGISGLRVSDSGNTYTLDDLTISNPLTQAVVNLPQNVTSLQETTAILRPGESRAFFFDVVDSLVAFILDWGGSSFRLEVFGPERRRRADLTRSVPPIEALVANAEPGIWKAVVTAVDVDPEGEPFALLFGRVEPGDVDRDGAPDAQDDCEQAFDPAQADGDGDGTGDACDNCPQAANSDQADFDRDGAGDVCDNCPTVVNADQADADADGVGDACSGDWPCEGAVVLDCADLDACTDDRCDARIGCLRRERRTTEPVGVTCSLTNLRGMLAESTEPACANRCVGKIERRMRRIEVLVDESVSRRSARACRRTLKAAGGRSRKLKKYLVRMAATGRLTPPDRAARMQAESDRLLAKVQALAASTCSR